MPAHSQLNKLGGANGVGRVDLVESRFVGMKSRGVYETPGGTILLQAHRAIESITLDKGAMHLKDEMMPKYAELIYNGGWRRSASLGPADIVWGVRSEPLTVPLPPGMWFTPEREAIQALIDRTQEAVTGTVRLKLYKGNVIVVGRKSPYSLYNQQIVTFEEDAVYDQARGPFYRRSFSVVESERAPVADPFLTGPSDSRRTPRASSRSRPFASAPWPSPRSASCTRRSRRGGEAPSDGCTFMHLVEINRSFNSLGIRIENHLLMCRACFAQHLPDADDLT